MPSGRFESAHWLSGIERSSTATPGSILVEIHSSRMDASQEVIEDGESIFIVFTYYCSLLRNCAAKLRRILAQGGLSVADGCRCLTKELDMIAC